MPLKKPLMSLLLVKLSVFNTNIKMYSFFQIIQHKAIQYNIYPLSPLSRHRLSEFIEQEKRETLAQTFCVVEPTFFSCLAEIDLCV